jgi:hypothetical protein
MTTLGKIIFAEYSIAVDSKLGAGNGQNDSKIRDEEH